MVIFRIVDDSPRNLRTLTRNEAIKSSKLFLHTKQTGHPQKQPTTMASNPSSSSLLPSQSPSLEMFTLFPKLPIELRLKIWKKHLEEPLDVHVKVVNTGVEDNVKTVFKLIGDAPAVLHTW
jgi:hypothetical protein